MSTLKGKGIIANVAGIVLTAGIVSGTNKAATQSAKHSRTSEKYEVVDANGDPIAQYFYGHRRTLSLTVIPYHDTTVAGAQSSMDAWRIPSGTLITVTDSDGTIIDDNYNLLSSEEGRSNSGAGTVDIVMESADANEIATAPIT